MTIRSLEMLGSEVLRTPAEEVREFDDDLRLLVRDLFQTMYHEEGVGLAAPQVGVSLRVFVVDVPWKGGGEGENSIRAAVVNPRIVDESEETEKAAEGCLSIPGLEGVVERPASVVIEGVDPEGEPIRLEASGLPARALQHELDHLEGILFLDRLGPLERRMLMKKWKKRRSSEAPLP